MAAYFLIMYALEFLLTRRGLTRVVEYLILMKALFFHFLTNCNSERKRQRDVTDIQFTNNFNAIQQG